ncbi:MULTISPECIES: DUF2855 family protein [unclassified Polaromonas]|jgi:hypothetical protein|uniref:DUF2855 family protein n=1 Tax=unclassified Polaromonas TaxID=2638319 RepID=UPI000BCA78D6|nr:MULTISPECIES: DUF2855 family protein [unclassified Polaromonas]OYY39651.1 MAG: hypothetical protein B7Y60_00285 [Polaromonas sp. 35-63-35]OYZ22395.1 MAG: hypothetical protein B7Y28_00285 [Polaromonas sp. 16-63-31]OYZ81383.1 MAG: hypothetical protein B7Y09_02870 [Polaromonas sp. 24-63-21]OZA52390.1 MAG: hypothetical protein B7X88_00280 [Polaromonas sp. 17-63-33]OZA88744.1 MAG: hypothetical protein B7X65_09345 [Polaromonas sp. 39-63-25]
MSTTTLLVRKNDLASTRLETAEDAPLAVGQVRMRVEAFALTSNNITYAAFGDAMNYWQFFPTGEEGWGTIPVWGFGSVVQSLHPGVAVGERLYGYYPMASATVLTPARLATAGFHDGAPHRRELHPVYNQYLRCSADPFYTPATEDIQALLRPLFITSFLIDDFLADNDFFGANVMLLSSASSKTAYGTAFQLAQRPGIEVIGLTSPANVAFCESLGCYSRVLTYDQLDQIAADAACIYVDFAGNAGLRLAIHTRFANLKYSCSIGGTHVAELGGARDLPGPRATLFFAPAQIKKRSADWGAEGLGQRLVQAWQTFSQRATQAPSPWLITQHHRGADAVTAAYQQVLAGKGDPRVGHILTL